MRFWGRSCRISHVFCCNAYKTDLRGSFFGKGSEVTKTLVQIQLAKNWAEATYDPEIQKKLGLK